VGATGNDSDRQEMQAWLQRDRHHQGIREDAREGVAKCERTGTMTCDKSPFNTEDAANPYESRRWSFVMDAAVGPLTVTAQLGVGRNKRNPASVGTPAQDLLRTIQYGESS
jgi:hypothetical protein